MTEIWISKILQNLRIDFLYTQTFFSTSVILKNGLMKTILRHGMKLYYWKGWWYKGRGQLSRMINYLMHEPYNSFILYDYVYFIVRISIKTVHSKNSLIIFYRIYFSGKQEGVEMRLPLRSSWMGLLKSSQQN